MVLVHVRCTLKSTRCSTCCGTVSDFSLLRSGFQEIIISAKCSRALTFCEFRAGARSTPGSGGGGGG